MYDFSITGLLVAVAVIGAVLGVGAWELSAYVVEHVSISWGAP